MTCAGGAGGLGGVSGGGWVPGEAAGGVAVASAGPLAYRKNHMAESWQGPGTCRLDPTPVHPVLPYRFLIVYPT